MEFRLLGPLEVWHEGRALDVRGLKRRAVLALLLLHANEVVSRDRLIDELWDEHPPANASAALQNHVSRLRKELGTEILATKDAGYLLSVEPDALDVWRFERLVAETEALAAAERSAKLDEALALWRGQALSDLLQEHTLAIESGRLEALRLSALERRIEADLELGRHEQLVPELEALIASQPLREHLRALLILALYRCGRQADALEAYRETRRALVDELGIDPGPELRELEQAILRQDPALDAPAFAAKPVPAAPTAPALPDAGETSGRRRWPLLVAAALLLGATGVAAALVVAGRSTNRLPYAVGDTTSFIPQITALTSDRAAVTQHTGNGTATTTTTAATTRSRGGSTHPDRPRNGTTMQRPVTLVAGGAPQPPPPAPPPPPPPPSPPPPPPPTPPASWAYWLTDNFSDPDLDAMWTTTKSGPGVEMAEQTDELQVWVPADSAPDPSKGIGEQYLTSCSVLRDFEATVDYRLRTWPSADGLHVTLWAEVGAGTVSIERVGGHADGFGGEAYHSDVHGDARVPTADTHGRFRLARHNNVLRAYYGYRGKWILLGAQSIPGQAKLGLSFSSDTPPWGGKPAFAAFDNFQAVVAGVDCPSGTPVPPRKRRT